MKRFPSNLTENDRRAYRRWACGFYLFYLAAITVAFGLTFASRPTSDLRASNEIQTARAKAAPVATDLPATVGRSAKP
jgi:hypothetical protein